MPEPRAMKEAVFVINGDLCLSANQDRWPHRKNIEKIFFREKDSAFLKTIPSALPFISRARRTSIMARNRANNINIAYAPSAKKNDEVSIVKPAMLHLYGTKLWP